MPERLPRRCSYCSSGCDGVFWFSNSATRATNSAWRATNSAWRASFSAMRASFSALCCSRRAAFAASGFNSATRCLRCSNSSRSFKRNNTFSPPFPPPLTEDVLKCASKRLFGSASPITRARQMLQNPKVLYTLMCPDTCMLAVLMKCLTELKKRTAPSLLPGTVNKPPVRLTWRRF